MIDSSYWREASRFWLSKLECQWLIKKAKSKDKCGKYWHLISYDPELEFSRKVIWLKLCVPLSLQSCRNLGWSLELVWRKDQNSLKNRILIPFYQRLNFFQKPSCLTVNSIWWCYSPPLTVEKLKNWQMKSIWFLQVLSKSS